MRRTLAMAAAGVLLSAGVASAVPLPGASGCPVFPANNVWHADVSSLPVHKRSAAWLSSASASTKRLHPDFGTSGDPDAPYGIPFHVVSKSHSKVNVAFDYDDESDPGPYPLGPDTPIEGGAGSGGDMHTITVDKDTCTLYETFYTQHTSSGWTAGSGAIWSMKSNAQRPAGWTSADAAGLPILPGLLRLDEVQAGVVDHAIRFTVSRTDRSYIWPARHQAGSVNDPNVPPMGARFRLKKSFDVSGFSAQTRVVLTAMKKYGLMLADNGSDWFFQGAASNGWPDTVISQLKTVPSSAFEAVDQSSLMVSAGSMAVKSSAPPATTPRTTAPAPPPSPTKPKATTAAPAATRSATPTRSPSRSATPVPSSTPLPGTTTTPPAVVAEPVRRRGAARNGLPFALLLVPLLGGAVAFGVLRRRQQRA